MTQSTLPQIWTLKEIADYFKVSEHTVRDELRNGNLHGFKIGQEWRCSDADLLTYISPQEMKVGADEGQSLRIAEVDTVSDFTDIEPFDFPWPKKGGGNYLEHYDKGYETTRMVSGGHFTFRIGFGNREVAGQMRRRVTVWIGNRAVVEFAGGNNYDDDGLVAGIIRVPTGTQLTPHQKVPNEYKDFKLARYNSIVHGPHASTNMAVVIHKDDLESMLRHAIIRTTYTQLI